MWWTCFKKLSGYVAGRRVFDAHADHSPQEVIAVEWRPNDVQRYESSGHDSKEF